MSNDYSANDFSKRDAMEALFSPEEIRQIEYWARALGSSPEEVARRVIAEGVNAVRRDINDRLLNDSLIGRLIEPEGEATA